MYRYFLLFLLGFKVLPVLACEPNHVTIFHCLNLKVDSTPGEVKKAFMKMQLKLHPDKNPGKEKEFGVKFQKLRSLYEAYETNPDAEIMRESIRVANECSEAAASAGRSSALQCNNSSVKKDRPETAYKWEANSKEAHPEEARKVPKSAPKPFPDPAVSPKREEFVEQAFRIKLHRVFKVASDPDAVWTEPLRLKNRRGILDRLRGKPRTLSNDLLKMNLLDMLNSFRGCFALNPSAERNAIFERVVEEGKAPDRGCYPAMFEDVSRFLKARGTKPFDDEIEEGTSVGYQVPPTMPNMDQLFQLGVKMSVDRGKRYLWSGRFHGRTGGLHHFDLSWDRTDYLPPPMAVICRCVGDVPHDP